jgi:bleomycin hydrolase
MSISPATVAATSATFAASPPNLLAQNALSVSDPHVILQKRVHSSLTHQHVYNTKIPTEFSCASQKSSGRCWIFACLNVLRTTMPYNLPDSFELSQTFVFFYDKLERVNFFLEHIMDTASEPLDGRLVQHLLSSPMNDGGQWEMLVNVITKYGVCPKSVYGEAWSATASLKVNRFLTGLLRSWAEVIRGMVKSGASKSDLNAYKQARVEDANRVLLMHFGTPPSSFTWDFHDKDKKAHSYQCTPLSFLNDHVNFKVEEQVSLINDPRNAYYKPYTVSRLGNVIGGRPVLYINVPIDVMKKYVKEILTDGKPVWFGCDVGKEFYRDKQVMDSEQFDYQSTYGVQSEQSKEGRLRYGQSLMTHAMVFTGCNVPEGADVPNRYRVENSWGTESGDKGYALMTDKWFDEYMYQITVDTNRLDDKIKECMKEEPVVLDPWDPMGSLA